MHCMPYKIFLKYFLGIDFYTVAFYSIISLTAFHASNVALLMLSPFFTFYHAKLSPIHTSHVALRHLPPSLDADEDVPEVNRAISDLKTVTTVMTSIVFNFLLCDCNE